ncbi:DNA polymerase IV [Klebsiella pneumoniae]|nr:DNA polymerase IV [Klebsiella pneumoniae]
MFAPADVNSFYASCEKVSGHLRGKPVVVLSNNDGCVIARSAEAKLLGIKMGTPGSSSKSSFLKIVRFSSNYELYASLSNRVVALLEELSPRVEQYSIDECFGCPGIGHCMDLGFWQAAAWHVLSGTGLTIGVGFGATKHWPNRRRGRQRNGHNSGGTGAVARKSTQNGKITQPAAGGRNLGRGTG